MKSFLKVGYGLYLKQRASDRVSMRWESLWNWIEPVSLAIIFWFLYQYKAISVQSNYPYALFVISGLLFWQIIVDCLNIPMTDLPKHKVIARQINIAPLAILTSFFLKIHYIALARVALVVALTAFTLKTFHFGMMVYLVYVELAILLFLGIGAILSLFNSVMADFSKMVNILMRALLFISGVVFPIAQDNQLRAYLSFNPFFEIIETSRVLLFEFDESIGYHMLLFTVFAVLFLLLGGMAFNRSVKWLFERV